MASNWGMKLDFNKLLKAIKYEDVIIGYPEGLPHNSGKADLDELALWNSEPEKEGKPKRPFLQDGIRANLVEINKAIREEYLRRLMGKPSNLDKIGVIAVTGVQEFVKGDYYKSHTPNAESTIKRKTSKEGNKKGQFKDKPLIDTAQMINGLTYKVVKS